ncbi:MAG: triosephosphate isomerase, partial [Halobacteriovoraceae bacterium]|nr:triosephosphate isomerase [Halobacteriovoraceae bacterium]
MSRSKYMVGNWKMNQSVKEIKEFFDQVEIGSSGNFWLAPQSIHIGLCLQGGQAKGIQVGAQNCSDKVEGAYTGELSPTALLDFGCKFTLVGHSERRSINKERNSLLRSKTLVALAAGLKVIFCVGETLEEREMGMTEAVIRYQLEAGL